MKLGTVKLEVIINGRIQTMILGGVEISNVKEVVINRIVHTKKSETKWIQHGKKREIELTHIEMVNKVQNADRNRKRFEVWASGYTVNILDRALDEAGKIPMTNIPKEKLLAEAKPANNFSNSTNNFKNFKSH